MKPFIATVGNPPYQQDIHSQDASRRVSVDIFPDLQETSLAISEYTSLIYPATWQKNVSLGLGRFLLDNGLYDSQFFPSQIVFGDAIRKNFPIAISSCKSVEENPPDETITVNRTVQMSRNLNSWIDHKAKQILVNKTSDKPKITGGAHPFMKLSNALDASMEFYDDSKQASDPDDTVSVYIKRKSGFQADGATLYTSWEALEPFIVNEDKFGTDKENVLSKHKATVPSAPLGRMGVFNEMILDRRVDISAQAFMPNSLFSNTKACVKLFDTEQEAQNFCSYLNSKFASILLTLDYSRKSFASFVPDLEDYTANSPVFSENTDDNASMKLTERLCDHFMLDAEEKAEVLSAEFGRE